MTDTNTKVFTITGDSLVAFVNDKMELVNRGELTRTDMIKDAGYLNDNGTAAYTCFYTELLRAKGVPAVTDTDAADVEYDDLSIEEQELYDAITNMLGEKWTHEETIEFMDELDEIGITTASQFEYTFEWEHDSYSSYAEKDFAEYFCVEVMDARIPDIVMAAIDWQDVWDHNLRYDYNSIETVNGTYFFRNN
jgi:hypothetical protein